MFGDLWFWQQVACFYAKMFFFFTPQKNYNLKLNITMT